MTSHLFRSLAVCLSLAAVVPSVAANSIAAPMFAIPEQREWSEVEEIQALATKAAAVSGVGRYQAFGSAFFFAPDGRIAMVMDGEGKDAEASSSMLGTHRRDGNWLEVRTDGIAINIDALSPEEKAEYDELNRMADDVSEAPAAADEVGASLLAEGTAEDVAPDASDDEVAYDVRRLLFIPYRGGELLLDAPSVRRVAASWSGDGPLLIRALAWRLPEAETPAEAYPEFSIDDPLAAPLPHELRSLLRRDSIETRMVEVVNPADALKWRGAYSEITMRLDRGSDHGLYPEMDLFGLPPDERIFARVTEVEKEHAIATFSIERFAPDEAVTLPTPGMRLTTRREQQGSTGCAIDTSVALRGKVVRSTPPLEEATWDEYGYAFVTLTLDQGSADGVMAGDRFNAERDELDGEGRVRGVSAHESQVTWRLQRYDAEQPIKAPLPGDTLVTPAWQRAAEDAFGAGD
jgi:hypothetical protein